MIESEDSQQQQEKPAEDDRQSWLTMEAGHQTGAKPGDIRYIVDAKSNNNNTSTSCIGGNNNTANSISFTSSEQSGSGGICIGGGGCGARIEIENDKKELEGEDDKGQMRSSCIESPQPQPLAAQQTPQQQQPAALPQHADGRIKSGSCKLLVDRSDRYNNSLSGERLSDTDLNCQPIRPALVGGASSVVEQRDLKVEWSTASLFKRAARFSGGSRSLCVRTGLVKSIKGGNRLSSGETIGRTIKSFVDNFRFNLKDRPDRKSDELRDDAGSVSSESTSEDSCVNDSDCLVNCKETEYEPSFKQKHLHSSNSGNCIRTSYSYQSMLNNPAVIKEQKELETTRSGEIKLAEYKASNDIEADNKLIMNISSSNITNSSPIIDNLVSGSGRLVAKNKYVIEDKLRRQKQQHQQTRMENRRSTHCSSIGALTADMNYDSSLSSGNNCSESNNTCTITNRQCSGENLNKAGDSNSNSCKRPSGGNQCNISINKIPIEGRQLKKRENWDKNIEFLLAVIGFAVDLGNVWRFPYICYKNGGGAFLIPYTIMFILGGLPIFYLEMSLGQYFSSGCLTVWKRVCPMAKGIGYAMCVLNFFTGLYYNTIISWAVFFFVESFTDVLPWTSCNNSWNSGDCKTIDQRQTLKSNSSPSYSTDQFGVNQTQQVHFSSPTKDYFEREVLQVHLSSGIDDLGYVRKPLAIYLAIVFICIYFAIWKGVKSTGKAVWITALLPYFVLIPLLIRGVFLEGAWLGIKYYLSPQWVKIIDVDVWVEAAKQIYFSLGPGFGTLMALSSYNKFNHNCRRDALIAASVNYFASFISGLVIFAVLGYMATIENVNINDVATEGPGLVFQVYPEGLATMGFSSMWSVLFFIMVITLGIDSTFGGLESVITGLCDEYPRVLRAHRGIFIGFLIVLIYLCSLPTTTYGGNYVIYVLESYGTSLSLLFIVLIETIIVCWLYGADRFCKNLEEMYGETPGAYWRICWKYISPTILLMIFIAACGQELDKYHILTNGDYTYPRWAPTVGLLMTGSSVCCIPIYAIYYLKTKTSGSFLERLKIAIRPIEGDQRGEKEIYVDALTDKIRDDSDVHLDTVI